jgi:exosortase
MSSNAPTFWQELTSILRLEERLRRLSFWMTVFVVVGIWFLFERAGSSVATHHNGFSLFTWLWKAWTDPVWDSAHGKLVPLISLGLLWMRRQQILAAPVYQDWRAVGLIIFALALNWIGMRGQIPRASVIALILLLWSTVWLLQGWARARVVAFPFAFLLFMIPMNFLESIVAFPMRMLVTKISVAISHFLGIAVQCEGTRLFNTAIPYEYDVAPACSGIRSLMTIIMLSLLYGFTTQNRKWKKIALFASGFPLAIAGNVLRITSIIVAAQCFGSKAGDLVHETFGYLIFVIIVILLLMVGYIINLDYPALWKKQAARLKGFGNKRDPLK